MKKMILLILILGITRILPAPGFAKLIIVEAERIQPYEKIWKATCMVESGNNPFAVGDKNLKDHSYGIVQIRMARLNDYYNKTGVRYNERDMFDPIKAKEVYLFYAMQFSHWDIKSISCEWNAGPNWKKVKSVNKYYLKIQYEINIINKRAVYKSR